MANWALLAWRASQLLTLSGTLLYICDYSLGERPGRLATSPIGPSSSAWRGATRPPGASYLPATPGPSTPPPTRGWAVPSRARAGEPGRLGKAGATRPRFSPTPAAAAA